MKRVLSRLMLLTGMVALFTGCTLFSFEDAAPVIQTDVESCEVRGSVSDGQSEITGAFTVSSNQSWSALVVDQEGNAIEWLAFNQSDYENASGNIEMSMLSFVLEANESLESREAFIKLTSQDCEKTVKVIQKPADPYVMVLGDQSLEMEPDATSASIELLANRTWTASVKDASKWSGFKVDTNSGGYPSSILSLSFPISDTPVLKEAVVTLIPDGGEPVDLTFTQSGMTIIIDFSEQPFTTPIGTDKNVVSLGKYILPWGGAEYNVNLSGIAGTTTAMWYAPTDGKASGGSVVVSKGWIDFPAVTGMTLKTVYVIAGATGKNWLVGENGKTSAVKGGEQFKLAAAGDEYTWTLAEPVSGQSYSLYTASTNSRIKYVKLIYR